MKLRSVGLSLLLVTASLLGFSRPAAAFESYIYGTAYDANTLQVLPDVCVVLVTSTRTLALRVESLRLGSMNEIFAR